MSSHTTREWIEFAVNIHDPRLQSTDLHSIHFAVEEKDRLLRLVADCLAAIQKTRDGNDSLAYALSHWYFEENGYIESIAYVKYHCQVTTDMSKEFGL